MELNKEFGGGLDKTVAKLAAVVDSISASYSKQFDSAKVVQPSQQPSSGKGIGATIGAALTGVADNFDKVASVAKTFNAALAILSPAFANVTGQVGEAVSSLVGAFNPESAKEYRKALQDLDKAQKDHTTAVQEAVAADKEASAASKKARKTGKPEDQEKAEKAEVKAVKAQTKVQATAEKVEDKKQDVKEKKKKKSPAEQEEQDKQNSKKSTGEKAADKIQSFVGSLQGAVGSVQGFVAALAPSSIFNFNEALDGLKATVGVAFQPIFDILAGTFRTIAGVIQPVMEALAPVIGQITQAISGILVVAVEALASVLTALMPIIQFVADLLGSLADILKPVIQILGVVLQALAVPLKIITALLAPVIEIFKLIGAILEAWQPILNAIMSVFEALGEALIGFIKLLFTGPMGDIIKQLVKLFQWLADKIIMFIAIIAKFFGAMDFLNKMIEGLKPKKGGQVKAAQNPAIKSFEQVANDLALASAAAAGGGTGKTKDEEAKERQEQMIKALEEIRDGPKSVFSKMVELLTSIRDALSPSKWVGKGPQEAARVAIDKTIKSLKDAAANENLSPEMRARARDGLKTLNNQGISTN